MTLNVIYNLNIQTHARSGQFIEKHYLHFNSAALVDAAKGYEEHLLDNGKMMITLAGAMGTAELGKSLAEMIRQDKVHIISCTGDNFYILSLTSYFIILYLTAKKKSIYK